MAELRKIGCKMREWRLRELSSLILQRSRFFTVIIFFHQQSLKNVHLKSRSWVHSEKQENQSKNRFNNIVACKFSTLQCMVDLQVYILVEDQYNEPPYIRQTPAPHFHSIRGRGQEYYSMIIITEVHMRQSFPVFDHKMLMFVFYPCVSLLLSFSDDHSRVILSLTENDPESHYINANYIDVSDIMKLCLK